MLVPVGAKTPAPSRRTLFETLADGNGSELRLRQQPRGEELEARLVALM